MLPVPSETTSSSDPMTMNCECSTLRGLAPVKCNRLVEERIDHIGPLEPIEWKGW